MNGSTAPSAVATTVAALPRASQPRSSPATKPASCFSTGAAFWVFSRKTVIVDNVVWSARKACWAFSESRSAWRRTAGSRSR